MSRSNQGSNMKGEGITSSRNAAQPIVPSPETVTSRALALSTYFFSGALSINLSQLLGSPLRFVNEDWYNAWIAFTKRSFGLLTMRLTQAFAPTTVTVSGDPSVRGQMYQRSDGSLDLRFPDRLVLVANHQIYTDWLYLWWIAYCNQTHGHLYIILKESLKRIPVLGWGMQLSQFIFLRRNWEEDKPHLSRALQQLDRPKEPMWLLLFPEGTNLAPDTREKSEAWAKKKGISDCRHVLLPRSTGLYFCLKGLKKNVDYLYDCTIAYEGVPRGQYAQDIFTLKAGYIEGRPPKNVCMYWRRFALKEIPMQNETIFNLWLTARWREKDLLLENYLRFGRFPSDIGMMQSPKNKLLQGCGRLQVQIKSNQWYEFLQIFAPLGVLVMLLYIFYGPNGNKEAQKHVEDPVKRQQQQQQHNRQGTSSPLNIDLDSIFNADQQSQTFQKLGIDMARRLQTPEAKCIIQRAGTVQKWLQNPREFSPLLSSLLHSLENVGEIQVPREKKANFLEKLRQEQESRRERRNASMLNTESGRHRGTFWKDLENEQDCHDLMRSRSLRQIGHDEKTSIKVFRGGGRNHEKKK